MSEWSCGGVEPLPGVPRVRIVDEEGHELFKGYYIRHENRQPAAFGGTDYLHLEDVDHCVAVDEFADWNMPRRLIIKKVTPPHRIEIIGPVPGEACELAGDGTPEGEPLPPIVDREALLALADRFEVIGSIDAANEISMATKSFLWLAHHIRECCGAVS